jgi:hypothetical protein
MDARQTKPRVAVMKKTTVEGMWDKYSAAVVAGLEPVF